MFFILSKTLHLLLAPLLWIVLLLLLGLFLKSERVKRGCLAAGIGLLLLLTNPFLANLAWRTWEVDAVPVATLGEYDAAIILTGVTGTKEHIPDRIHTYKGSDRFLHPLMLYRLGKIKKFIVTGGTSKLLRKEVPEAVQIKTLLMQAGVPAQDIITESRSQNTYQNAQNTAILLKQHPDLQRLLLVTSAFHMRRAAACFSKAGIKATSFSTDFYSNVPRYTPDELFIPSAYAFSNWHLLIHEIAGYVTYKLIGYC
ncbi:YdcF family protein [Pontibacter ruber]|uniref:YdcF family protein n=1 Tax=Pontibacter ruber TaxID=1343895 RepID=A0ABW5CWA5_9BACT|nr:YdcF family protein [Pontibacter ruber]